MIIRGLHICSVIATLGACGNVEPGDPYVTTAPVTVSSVGTADTGADASSDTGSSGTSGSVADTTGADTTADTTAESGDCPSGTEACPCDDGDTCDPGLTCLSNICVDAGPVCPTGTAGCPCTVGGTCDPGLSCVSMTCVE